MFGIIYKVYKIDNNDVHSTSRISKDFSRTQNPNLNDKRRLVENLAIKNYDTEIIDEDEEALSHNESHPTLFPKPLLPINHPEAAT